MYEKFPFQIKIGINVRVIKILKLTYNYHYLEFQILRIFVYKGGQRSPRPNNEKKKEKSLFINIVFI